MPVPLRFPGEVLALPRYYQRVVIPQANVRTLFSVPVSILGSNPNEIPFVEHVTLEKTNGVAYSGSTSVSLIIDAKGVSATPAFTLTQSLVLGIVSGKSVFRNYGGNDTGEYAGGDLSFGKTYQIRLSIGPGSDFSAGTGDLIIELFYTSVLKTIRV